MAPKLVKVRFATTRAVARLFITGIISHVFLTLLDSGTAQLGVAAAVVSLTSQELKAKMEAGEFAVVVDVRADSEWAGGHVDDATHVAGLQNLNSVPAALQGCGSCKVAVYCRSGARAQVAAEKLLEWGFTEVYNGQGVNQWQAAGYALVNTPSKTPLCSCTTGCMKAGTCAWNGGASDSKAESGDTESGAVSRHGASFFKTLFVGMFFVAGLSIVPLV